MVETKKIKAHVMEITEKSGETNGKAWTKYNYEVHIKDVGKRYMSTFRKIENVPINYEVEIEYREKPNPIKPEYPTLTIEKITWDKVTAPSSDMTEAQFKAGYLERADISAMQLNHFIGTYCRKYAPDIAKKATELYNSK